MRRRLIAIKCTECSKLHRRNGWTCCARCARRRKVRMRREARHAGKSR